MADMMNTQSETEVEQQMYQAMAAQMQSEGMNVTAEEIAQTVEEQTSDNPPEPSEKDTEIMEQMAAYHVLLKLKKDENESAEKEGEPCI